MKKKTTVILYEIFCVRRYLSEKKKKSKIREHLIMPMCIDLLSNDKMLVLFFCMTNLMPIKKNNIYIYKIIQIFECDTCCLFYILLIFNT